MGAILLAVSLIITGHGLSCVPGAAAGSGISCRQWQGLRFASLNDAVAYFSRPGASSTSDPRAYLARFVQPDGSVEIRVVP